MAKKSQQTKLRSDVRLTPDRLGVIEACLKQRMTHRDIGAITGVNGATISAVKLTLAYVGRL